MANLRNTREAVNTDQSSAAEARIIRRGSGENVGHKSPNFGELGTGTERPAGSLSPLHPTDSQRRAVGGQAELGLFGVPGFDFREAAAEAKAAARQEATVSQREAARLDTARRLREFRQALGAKPASPQGAQEPTQPQGHLTPGAIRALYGNAQPAFAAASRAQRAERECQPKPPTCRFAPGEALPVFPSFKVRQAAAEPARNRAISPASALKASAGGVAHPRRSVAFCEEAEAKYEAHMAEVAEARSHQLDAETDRYACTFAGAGYTEYLMAIEG